MKQRVHAGLQQTFVKQNVAMPRLYSNTNIMMAPTSLQRQRRGGLLDLWRAKTCSMDLIKA